MSDLVGNPEDRFTRVAAHLWIKTRYNTLLSLLFQAESKPSQPKKPRLAKSDKPDRPKIERTRPEAKARYLQTKVGPEKEQYWFFSYKNKDFHLKNLQFLAHLSRRLTGELIVYPCSGFRHRCCCPQCSNIFSNKTTGQSLSKGNQRLYKWSRSHYQDGRHAHIW